MKGLCLSHAGICQFTIAYHMLKPDNPDGTYSVVVRYSLIFDLHILLHSLHSLCSHRQSGSNPRYLNSSKSAQDQNTGGAPRNEQLHLASNVDLKGLQVVTFGCLRAGLLAGGTVQTGEH